MKKISISLLSVLLLAGSLSAQQNVVYHPTLVAKPVYFDVSPPLKDMAAMGVTKGDNSWKDGVVKNQPNPFRNRQNPWEPDPVVQRAFGTTSADTTIENFPGNTNTQGVIPPDTYGEVGPTRYFQVVNLHYAIYTKTGTKILQANNSSVWNGLPNNSNDGDATLNYDEVHDRWVFSQFSLPNFPTAPFFQMIAVSQTNDPTGSWYRYQYQFSFMGDYPKMAIWPDGIYMSANRFSSGSTTYQGTAAVSYNYAKMLTGDPSAEMVLFTLPASNAAYCFLPSDCDGEFPPVGTPNYFAYLNDGPDQIVIYEFKSDWTNTANSTFTQTTVLPVDAFNGSLNGITQKGNTVKLDDLSGRLMYRMQFRKFSDHWSMVANATVNAGSGIAGIRWFELRSTGSAWSIYQQGTYNPDNNSRWMGSIAMDQNGNIGLGFSIASSTIYASIRYTGRKDGDPLGQMTLEEKGIMNGGGAQTDNSSRWGDYSGMSVDPADPGTFWYTQEYIQSTTQVGWRTRIASFSIVLKAVATATPQSVCLGDTCQLNASGHGGSGTYTYSWTSIPAGFTSTLSNPTVIPAVNTQYICAVNDGSSTTTDTVAVTVHNEPTAFAGSDQNLNFTVITLPLSGQATDYASVKWTTTGDGSFASDTSLSTVYSTGWQERMAGTMSVTLTANPIPSCATAATSTMNVIFSPAVGVQNLADGNFSILVTPNPASGSCTLTLTHLKDAVALITLTDLTGRQVYTSNASGPAASVVKVIDLSGVRAGVYFLRVKTDTGTKSEKIIVE